MRKRVRIFSKFSDYYDSAMAYGQDPAIAYRRETRAITAPTSWVPPLKEILGFRSAGRLDEVDLRLCLIGFCGQGHFAWFPRSLNFTAEYFGTDSTNRPRISEKEVLARLEAYNLSLTYTYWSIRDPWLKAHVTTEPIKLDPAWFHEIDAPVFITHLGNYRNGFKCPLIVNPRMATLGFESRVDPFTAFQEIAMFLGHQLAPEDNAPRTVGDDKVIAASKGFDEQSFRTTAPGAKKLNRQANQARKRGKA